MGLTEEERCIALAKEALVHLFPEIPTTEFELRDNWFSKAGFISTLNHFDEYWETTIKNSKREKELVLLKNEILKDIQTARFKEYYTVKVGTPIENGTAYFIVAVSKEFDHYGPKPSAHAVRAGGAASRQIPRGGGDCADRKGQTSRRGDAGGLV